MAELWRTFGGSRAVNVGLYYVYQSPPTQIRADDLQPFGRDLHEALGCECAYSALDADLL